MEYMEPSALETQFHEHNTAPGRAMDRRADWKALGFAGILLLGAAVAQFVIGPAVSPGFTYLAVVLALAGIGALLAAGLET